MNFQQFKKINNITGWLMFLFAAAVYTLTMEGTASLWDCGEFIASAYKLQVVHPPGAPLFLMIGRMFTLLAGGNPDLISVSMNFMSAICSAFSIMFLFWITTHIARRMLISAKEGAVSVENTIVVIGAGLIAAMSGTFLDSVWFSATEAEVYSMSLMWTSIVFWAMLKWEERADEPYADKWLLFIAFMVGCSIFVHWLNLLSIPAITFIYYFKRYKSSRKGMMYAFLASIAIVGFILWLIIPGLVAMAASLELMMVNGLGMPFNSGVILFLLMLIGGLVGVLFFTYKKGYVVLHNATIGLMFILIGYSTITTTVIRSNAEPNIDMNSPRDIVSLSSYLNREQYGSRPFLFGHYYTDKVEDVKVIGTKYFKGKDRYEDVGDKIEYVYSGKSVFFPRVYDQNHADRYEQGLGIRKGKRPTYMDNLKFFFSYQIGHMYVRYFMWNFVGRQNDEQGLWGDKKNGNWVSGINVIDGMRLGSQSYLPDHIKNNPNRNTFYFLPLLLGLLGLVFHFTNDRKRAFVIFLLFFFCGVSIIIQGNSPPIEPRERDYIFAASFYAFTIWLGIGLVALYDILKAYMSGKTAAGLATVLCLSVPALMGFQGWEDHDRSGRYAARDFAANYLNSCAPNAILFTQGDNDTYPLWYAQEVEGIRRDVRVVNLSLLGVDWYIEQLRRKVNDAAPVPMTLSSDKVRGTERDVVYFKQNTTIAPENTSVELKEILRFIADSSPQSRIQGEVDYYPTRNFKFKVNEANFAKQNALAPEDTARQVSEIEWRLSKQSLYKNDLMVLDIIAANDWEQPVYFAISVAPDSYLGLEKYFQLEGLAYRLVPAEVQYPTDPSTGRVDQSQRGNVQPDIMYDNLLKKFKFGNIETEGIHVDTDLRRMIFNFRGNFARLAEAFLKRGDKQKAIEVLDYSQKMMPDHAAQYNFYMFTTIDAYYEAGAYEKANELTEIVATRLVDELKYIERLPKNEQKYWDQETQLNNYFIQKFIRTAKEKGEADFTKKLEEMSNI